jgi:hypothetical protein
MESWGLAPAPWEKYGIVKKEQGVTQGVSERFWQAEARTEETRQFIRDINRIVLEGFRRDTPIRDLCHRESLRPSTCYTWLKDFMQAGKERLQGDTVKHATRAEVEGVKRENARLKQLVA